MALVFSTALPVQFWLAGCDTFNENEKDGLNDECWCQPWRCDQIMPIRFLSETGITYVLSVLDGNEILEAGIEIPEVSEGYYSYDLPLTEYCNKKIQVLILESGASTEYINSELSDPSPFVKVGGYTYPWRIPTFTDDIKERTSPILPNPIVIGDDLDLSLGVAINNTSSSFTVSVVLMQSYGSATQVINFGSMTTLVTETQSVTATANFDQVKVIVSDVTFSGAVTTDGNITIYELSILRLTGSDIGLVDNPAFTGSLSPWTNEGVSGTNWTYSSNTATVTNLAPGSFSKNLRESLSTVIPAGKYVQVTADFLVTGGGTSMLEVGFSDDGSTGWQWFALTSGSPGGGTLTNDAHYIAFRQTRTGGVGSTIMTVNALTDIVVSDPLIMDNAHFTGALTPWTNEGSGTDWTYSSNKAVVTNSSPGAVSKNLRNALSNTIAAGSDVQVAVDFAVTAGTSDLELGFSDDGSTGWQWFTMSPGVENGGILADDANFIALRQTRTNPVGATTVQVDSISSFSIDGVDYSLGVDGSGYEQIEIPNGWSESGSGFGWSSTNKLGTGVYLDRTGFLVRFLGNSISSVEATGLSIPDTVDLSYTLEMTTVTDQVGGIDMEWTLQLLDSLNNVVGSASGEMTSETNTTFSGVIDLSAAVTKARLTANNNGAVQNIRLEVNELVLGSSVIVAKSDCHFIKTAHKETKEFIYSNNRNFAGLIYEDISPAEEFSILVPCVFFHKRFPQEVKGMERTSDVVVTSSKIKTQKLLQVKHAPDYFHEKLILILSHHNVSDGDGVQYRKEEPYEKEDGDPLYPLKKATCYLTEKNSVKRNVL